MGYEASFLVDENVCESSKTHVVTYPPTLTANEQTAQSGVIMAAGPKVCGMFSQIRVSR